jgi:hypothetical protein
VDIEKKLVEAPSFIMQVIFLAAWKEAEES